MPAFSDWQESVLSIFVSAPCVRLSELSTIMTRFPCIASHPTLRTMGRSRSAAIESAQENLKTAFTSNPPSAIQAKYVPHRTLDGVGFQRAAVSFGRENSFSTREAGHHNGGRDQQ